MANIELVNHFAQVNWVEVADTTKKWKALPPLPQVLPEVFERANKLVELVEPAKGFSDENRLAVSGFIRGNDYLRALAHMAQRLEEIDTRFSGDTAVSARIFAYHRRGFVQEHLATFGELSQLPLGDVTRTNCFLSSATDYMKSDLEWGVIGDYAMRISECFGGAGIVELQVLAAQKLFGNNFKFIGDSVPDAIFLKDLERRALDTLVIPSTPHSGPSKLLILVQEPNTQIN